MKELTLTTLVAVLEEMLGRATFRGLVAAAALVTLAFVLVLVRERRLSSRRLVRAELAAPLGALLAVAFVFWTTDSGPAAIGGPIDWVVVAAIAALGAGGAVVGTYVVMGLSPRRRRGIDPHAQEPESKGAAVVRLREAA